MEKNITSEIDYDAYPFTNMVTSPPPMSLNPHDAYLDKTVYDGNNSSNATNFSVHPAPPFLPCDNPRNVVSPFVADMVDLVIFGGILPVLVIHGVITNVINMVVFAKQGLSDRIHLCLFSLAVSDTGYLLFIMAGKSYTIISLVDPVTGNYWRQGHYMYAQGSYLAFEVMSITTTAIIAMERCLCILSPLKAAVFLRAKYTGLVIVVMTVFTLAVLNTSLALKYEVWQVTDPLTNTSTFIVHLTSTYLRHRTLIDVIYLYLLLVTVPFASLVIVVVCTAAIIIRLKAITSWRHKSISSMTSVEKQEASVSRMLVTVCCVYVICISPSAIIEFLLFIRFPGFLPTEYLCNLFEVTVALAHMLEAFNASINFHIYIRQSSLYRSTFKKLCHSKGVSQGKSENEAPSRLEN